MRSKPTAKPAAKARKPRRPSAAKPPGEPLPADLVPLEVAARMLDRSDRALRRWRARGAPFVSVDGRSLCNVQTLARWAYAQGLRGGREPPGPRPKAKTSSPPATGKARGKARSTAPAEAPEGERGRTFAELEAALATGGEITAGERERIRDLLLLRQARREKARASKAAATAREQRAGLVDLALVNARLLRGAARWRAMVEELAPKRDAAWRDDVLDVLDAFLQEAMPDMHTPAQNRHPDASA